MGSRTGWRRHEHLDAAEGAFDLVVIGGGIVGAGIALDAASRAKQVLIVERDDWAAGTSSRSTKLLHGGVRYLPQMRFGLIRRGLREQRILGTIADYLVDPIDFVIPVYRGRGFADAPAWARHPRIFPLALRLGLWWYDRLGVHDRRAKRILSRDELARRFPLLKTHDLRHGVAYRDAQTNDARLTLMVTRTAVDHGAIAVNHSEVVAIEGRTGAWSITFDDRLGGTQRTVRAGAIAAATGAAHPPGDQADPLPIVLSKGVHLTVGADEVGIREAALVLPETSDGRVLFLVPWLGHVVVGTTDTEYTGDLAHPVADDSDVRYLCDEVASYLEVDAVDPISSWAGLRALVGKAGGSTAQASREHRVVDVAPGFVRVAGGKLTGYRAIAEDVVDRLYGRRRRSRAGTSTIRLHGAGITAGTTDRIASELTEAGAPTRVAGGLVGRYGTEAGTVVSLVRRDPGLAEPIGDRWLAAEVVHAARSESAATITDFVQRRTRIAWFTRDHARGALSEIGRILGGELGWDEQRIAREVERTERDLELERL